MSVVAERRGGAAPDSVLERRIRAAVEGRVRAELDRVHPFVRVTVLPSPGSPWGPALQEATARRTRYRYSAAHPSAGTGTRSSSPCIRSSSSISIGMGRMP